MKPWPWFVGSIVLVALAVYAGLSQRSSTQTQRAAQLQMQQQTAMLAAQLEEQRRVNEATLQKLKEIEERDRQAQEQAAQVAQPQAAQAAAAEAEKQRLPEEAAATEKARLAEVQRREAEARLAEQRAAQQQAAEQKTREQEAIAEQERQRGIARVFEKLRQEGSGTATQSQTTSKQTLTLPVGTKLVVSLSQNITSRMQAGDTFEASLEEPLQAGGVEVAPKGAGVLGQIMTSQQAGRVSGRSELVLQLARLRLGSQEYTLQTSDYEARGKGQGKSTVKGAIGGAAVGALIGAIAGGGKGAATGAAIGGGAGVGAELLIRGQQLNIPAETILEFTLAQAMSITK